LVLGVVVPTVLESAGAGADPDAARVSALVESHLLFVKHVAGKLARRLPLHVCVDDLLSAGLVGLLHAARRFDPGRDTSFAHFAHARIRGAMLDELRALDWVPRRRRRETVAPSMTDFSSLFEDEDPPLVFRGRDPADRAEADDWRDFALRNLTDQERRVITLHYFGGLTGVAIARALKLSEARITRIRQQAIRRLRRRFRRGMAA